MLSKEYKWAEKFYKRWKWYVNYIPRRDIAEMEWIFHPNVKLQRTKEHVLLSGINSENIEFFNCLSLQMSPKLTLL